MADGVDDQKQLVRATDDRALDGPVRSAIRVGRHTDARPARSPHSHKFHAAIATLIGVAIGAIVVSLAVVANGTKASATPRWSSWKPPDNGTLGAREIADHIAPMYRISAVDQLDVVTVVNLSSANASATTTTGTGSGSGAGSGLQVAVQSPTSASQVALLGGNTIAYNLCGIGSSNCAIGVGTPSSDRLLLLRREALELALYTFKYIGGVQNVVAILPPGHTVQESTLSAKPPAANAKAVNKPVDLALLFLKDELKPWLSIPIAKTLPLQFPPTVPQLSLWRQTVEAGLVAQITERGLFTEKLVQAQDGSNLIVLDPQPPQ